MATIDNRCLKGGEYFNIYQKIFAFHKKYVGVRTDHEWFLCVSDFSEFKEPFEKDLAVAVMNELDRDAAERDKNRSA